MTLQQQLEAALVHHRAGRLGQAEMIYRQILATEPKNADALFLLGSLAHQAGKFDIACDLLNQAILLNPTAADYHLNLGVVLTAQARLAEAVTAFRKALALRPQHVGYLNLGIALSQMGQLDSAVTAYREALALEPNQFLTHMMLGNTLRELGRTEEAVASYRHALALNPRFADVHNTLGAALAQLNRLQEAVDSFQQAIALNPDLAEAYNNLGQALTTMNRLEEAVAAFQKAVALRPNCANAYNGLGIALKKLGRLEPALAAFRQAVTLKPGHAEYLNNMGMMLGDSGDLEEALAVFRHLITLKPSHAEYVYNLGVALEDLGRPEDALAAYRQTLALKPDYPEAHMNSGMVHLLLGDLAAGWKEYEWRSKCPHVPMQRNIPQPQWTGGDLEGKTILLHWEQGLGDTLHFIRYAPLIAARGGKVILKCQPELQSLMKGVDGIGAVAVDEQSLPPFQLHCPLANLPLAFATTLDTIPVRMPYVTAPLDRALAWRERIGAAGGPLRIGLAWAGKPIHRNDRRRSMRLDQFSPLAELKSARFFSLQKGPAADQSAAPPPEIDFVDWTADLRDFAETAALIANLDLVICVDTSIAHLAGAMAKSVWLLLPFVPDWRWMLNRTDSPWYPTMRLFRQAEPGDWAGVMASVIRAILQQKTD
ncbi:MAG: tetratricopeptide repeat protein [Tepidisphaeraceae bacterium]